ncbi:MAG: SCO1664 family protein [Chloroflexi bacterium]|nr:SCO1664 family protein [Chloroflexota bacterium]
MRDCQLAPQGSNYTYFVTIGDRKGRSVRAVYKPRKGEAPLWDFPEGTLYLREFLAYRLSEALGWGLVPYTVTRDGKFGVGSVQLFVETDPQASYFTLRESHPDRVQQLCVFDVIANNADRKASHCLLGLDGRVWGIDHGITFHWENKLRTVIWDYAGRPVPEWIARDIARLAEGMETPGGFRDEMADWLSQPEVEAFCRRVEGMLQRPVFPYPGPRRSVPWPWM